MYFYRPLIYTRDRMIKIKFLVIDVKYTIFNISHINTSLNSICRQGPHEGGVIGPGVQGPGHLRGLLNEFLIEIFIFY